jgi:outer membrane protein TolC
VAYIGAVQKAVYDTFDTYLEAAASRLRMDESGRRARLLGQQAQGESALSASGLNDQQAMRSLIAEKARIEADLSVETARYAETLGQLAYHTGLAVAGVQPSDVPASVMGAERQVTPAAAVESALKNNPELLAMAIDVVARDLGRKQAIATDFAPVLDLFAKMEQETRAGSRFGGGSVTQDTTMGVQLRLPIFNANGNGLRTVQANVDLRSGVVAYHATKRRIETEIAMTLQRMSQLTAAMGQMSTAAQQARANVDAEQALVASGQSTDLQLISRQLLESQLKEAAAEQRIEYLRAWARLQYLTGAMTADAL